MLCCIFVASQGKVGMRGSAKVRSRIDCIAADGRPRPDDIEHLEELISDQLAAAVRLPDLGAPDLFRRDIWMLLLEVMLAGIQHRPYPVNIACLRLGGPPTTALRRLQQMEARGLLCGLDDPRDRRRRLIVLAAPTRAALLAWFGQRHVVSNDDDIVQPQRPDPGKNAAVIPNMSIDNNS